MTTISTPDFKSSVSAGIASMTGNAPAFEGRMEDFFSKYPEAEALVTAEEAAEQIVAGLS